MSEYITYGALDNALVVLGFGVTEGPNYRSYYHAGTQTTIVTPNYPLEQAADEMRLATIRTMIATRGIARPERLEDVLHGPSDRPNSAGTKRSSVRITHLTPVEAKA